MNKPSLAASAGVLAEAPKFQLPAVFQEPNDKLVGRFTSPYITFAHKSRPDEYSKLMSKYGNVDEGEMFLMEAENCHKLPVAKLSLMKAKQYWVEKNAAGETQRASWTEMPRPWAEHMDVVVLVYFDDHIVVANINPHTTKCSGIRVLADALEACQKPEWAEKSPAHRETLQINQPFMRFFGEMTLSAPRISKASGLPYRTTQCVIKPTTNVEAKLLKFFAESAESNKQLTDAAERFSYRIREIESKLVKK